MSCHSPLDLVQTESGENVCKKCNWVAGGEILNFVVDPALRDELQHYDTKWSKREWSKQELAVPADPGALHQLWVDDPRSPTLPAVRARIGDVRDKVVVVLGNGVSVKELSLLRDRPRLLVISDLTLAGLGVVRDHQREMETEGNVTFAAVDALDMPFEDDSVDILYGEYFVSQLPDVDRFLREAVRVLAPGGRAVFKDRGQAPALEWAKRGMLRSVRRASQERWTLSPGDRRFMAAGNGFRTDELDREIRVVGGTPWLERGGLVHFGAMLVNRAYTPPNSRWRLSAHTWERENGTWRLRVKYNRLLTVLNWVDRLLHHLAPVRRNESRLVWGFDLDQAQAGSEPGRVAAHAMVEQ
jgi:SAM-dependent methyltransferase